MDRAGAGKAVMSIENLDNFAHHIWTTPARCAFFRSTVYASNPRIVARNAHAQNPHHHGHGKPITMVAFLANAIDHYELVALYGIFAKKAAAFLGTHFPAQAHESAWTSRGGLWTSGQPCDGESPNLFLRCLEHASPKRPSVEVEVSQCAATCSRVCPRASTASTHCCLNCSE